MRDSPSGLEVFLVRRHEGTAFMGGAHVFPGGRVDVSDREGDPSWCDGTDQAVERLRELSPEEAVAYHVAAVRELFEEVGVLLARDVTGRVVSFGEGERERFSAYRIAVHSRSRSFRAIVDGERLRLALDALTVFAHWVTPPIDTRAFDTRFFVARVPPGQTAAHDRAETTHGAWLAPSAAIESAGRGGMVLPPPTWTTLREIEAFATVDEAIRWATRRRVVRRQPRVVEEGVSRMLVLPGDPSYPADGGGEERPVETRFVLRDGYWRPA